MPEPFRVEVRRGGHGKGRPGDGPVHGVFGQVIYTK